jgi:cellulose biosynthesis protein BcsQ
MSDMAVKIISCSDIILIPVSPSDLDIEGTVSTIDHVKTHMELTNNFAKAFLVVSKKQIGTTLGLEVYNELAEFELPVFKTCTTSRVKYIESIGRGKTIFDNPYNKTVAALEFALLAEELEEMIKLIGDR